MQHLFLKQIFSISSLPSTFHYPLANSLLVFADKLASSMQTGGNHSNLLVTKTIQVLMLHHLSLCNQFHTGNCQPPPATTHQLVVKLFSFKTSNPSGNYRSPEWGFSNWFHSGCQQPPAATHTWLGETYFHPTNSVCHICWLDSRPVWLALNDLSSQTLLAFEYLLNWSFSRC